MVINCDLYKKDKGEAAKVISKDKNRRTQNKYINMIRSIITSGGALILNCMINLILTPYISKTAGTDAYGFVSLAKTFSIYASILTVALNSYASRHVSVAYHQNEREKANIFHSSVFYGNVILSTAIMAVSIPFIIFMEHILNIPERMVLDVKILFFLTMFTLCASTILSTYSTAAIIADRLDISGIFKILSYVSEIAVLVICYKFLPTMIFYVGIGILVSAMVTGFAGVYINKRYVPKLIIRKKYYRRYAVKRLVGDGIWQALNLLGVSLNNGLDLLTCNLLLTSIDMGNLAIAKTFHSVISGAFVLIGQAFHPMFLKAYSENDKETLLKDLKLSMKISGMFANIAFAGFFALGIPFYKLWIPTQDINVIYILTVLDILVVIPGGPMQPLYYIYTLTVKNKFPTIVTILGGCANVAGMYVLIKFFGMGVNAVVITTAVVMGFTNFVSNPIYMAKVLNIPKITFYPDIFQNLVSCTIMVFVFRIIGNALAPASWLNLGVSAILCAIAGIPIHAIITCDREQIAGIKKVFVRN